MAAIGSMTQQSPILAARNAPKIRDLEAQLDGHDTTRALVVRERRCAGHKVTDGASRT